MRRKKKKTGFIYNIITTLLSNKIWIFLPVFVVVALMAIYNYDNSLSHASMRMKMNYAKASNLQNPNGTKFSMYEIKSKEVCKIAIEKAGLENQLSPETLSSAITVTTARTQAPKNEDAYYVTAVYNISYKQPKELKDISARSMLSILGDAYEDYFYDRYSDKHTVLEIDIDDKIENLEYLEVAELFRLKANEVQSYFYKRNNEDGTFRSSETGVTFKNLAEEIENFLELDVNTLASYIKQSSLTKNRTKYLGKLRYENRALEKNYANSYIEFAVRSDVIQKYDAALTGVVLIPTWDVSKDFYMSRTKIGVDYIADKSEQDIMAFTTFKDKIDKNNQKISNLSNLYTDNNKNQADEMIESMLEKLKDITKRGIELDNEYIKAKTQNYVAITINKQGFMGAFGVKKLVFVAVVLTMINTLLVFYFQGTKRKDR